MSSIADVTGISSSTSLPEHEEQIVKNGKAALIQLAASVAIEALACSYMEEINPLWIIADLLISNAANIKNLYNIFAYYTGLKTLKTSNSWSWLNPILFHAGSACRIHTLIHEMGHFSMTKGFYPNASPRILLKPIGGGSTPLGLESTLFNSYSDFYNIFFSNLRAFSIFAGGPIFSFLSASTSLMLGNLIQNKYPNVSSYFKISSYMDFFYSASYAGDALLIGKPVFWKIWEQDYPNHDFVQMHQYGLHPAIPMIGYLVAPILINLKMNGLFSSKSEQTSATSTAANTGSSNTSYWQRARSFLRLS